MKDEKYNGLYITNSRFESGTIHPTQVTIDNSPLATKADLAAKQNVLPSGDASKYLRGDLTMQTLASMPVSSATQSALNAKAGLSSPAFTGTPTAPTAAANANTAQIATTAHVYAAKGNFKPEFPVYNTSSFQLKAEHQGRLIILSGVLSVILPPVGSVPNGGLFIIQNDQNTSVTFNANGNYGVYRRGYIKPYETLTLHSNGINFYRVVNATQN